MQTTLGDGYGKKLIFLESTPQKLRFDARILKPWMGYMTVSLGLMVLIGSAEQFSYEPSFVAWSFIVGYGGFFTGLLILGIYLLFARPKEVSYE